MKTKLFAACVLLLLIAPGLNAQNDEAAPEYFDPTLLEQEQQPAEILNPIQNPQPLEFETAQIDGDRFNNDDNPTTDQSEKSWICDQLKGAERSESNSPSPALIENRQLLYGNTGLSIETTGRAPQVTRVSNISQSKPVSPKNVLFLPADVRHRRLLFEQPHLERHGLTRNETLQPFVSGAHFFGSVFAFPFELVKNHHRWCDSSLGWGTPGSPLPGCNSCAGQ